MQLDKPCLMQMHTHTETNTPAHTQTDTHNVYTHTHTHLYMPRPLGSMQLLNIYVLQLPPEPAIDAAALRLDKQKKNKLKPNTANFASCCCLLLYIIIECNTFFLHTLLYTIEEKYNHIHIHMVYVYYIHTYIYIYIYIYLCSNLVI